MDTVESRDGTTIAFDRSGAGPPIILVGGVFNDRLTAAPLARLLAPHLTVFAYDRRGRGASGDTPPYAVQREVEDLEVLIAAAGGTAFVYGPSSGAGLALEAAAQGLPITGLALFEPPFVVDDSRPPPPADLAAQYTELTGAGRRSEAVELFMTRVGLPAKAIARVRGTSVWPGLEAMAHTLAYDATIMDGGALPTERLASITTPALMIDSTASPGWLRNAVRAVAAVLPTAQHRSLPGQIHDVAPETLAPALASFFADLS